MRCQSPRDCWQCEKLRLGGREETHLGALEPMVMSAICICKDAVLVLESAISSDRRVSDGRE